MSNYKHLLMIK